MTPPAEQYAVIIPNWNGAAFIERCLGSVQASLRRAGLADVPIIVHDDASDDDSPRRIKAGFPGVELLESGVNIGFAESVNRAMRHCRARWVFLLNNDLALQADFCERLIASLETCRAEEERQGEVFVIGAQTRDWATHEPNHAGQRILWAGGMIERQAFASEVLCETGFFQAGACLIDREKFLDLGGFPPLFHPGYWEDYDLAYAAHGRGWRVLYEPRSTAWHCGQGSMRRRYGQWVVSLMQRRNHLLFVWANLHDPARMTAHLAGLPLLVMRGAPQGEAGWLRALLAALGRLPDALRLRRRRRRGRRIADRALLGAGTR